jgi:phosphate transport system substrate-binding protein
LKRKIITLSLATAVGVACLSASLVGTAAGAANDITGAGSTLIAPLESKWAADFQAKYGIKVTYGAVGSGAGISQVSARTVDFGASDAPLTPAQAAGCHGCIQIPWALSGIALAFHVSGVSRLNLNGPVLTNIYLGKITSWNNPQIKALNKGVKLPGTKVTPVFRSDGSGSTYAFTDYLSHVSAAFKKKVGVATQVSFPTGVGGKGSPGVAAVIKSTDGAIGYLGEDYTHQNRLGSAAIQNAAGKFIFPNLGNISAAASSVKKVPSNNELHIVNPGKKYGNAYPISTFTYAIVPQASKKRASLASWIYYAATAGQTFGPPLFFPALPTVVKNAAVKSVQAFQQA